MLKISQCANLHRPPFSLLGQHLQYACEHSIRPRKLVHQPFLVHLMPFALRPPTIIYSLSPPNGRPNQAAKPDNGVLSSHLLQLQAG